MPYSARRPSATSALYFPSSDPRWHDAPSADFLTYTRDLLRQEGWRIGNVDASVVAERPRLSPHIPAMRAKLAELLSIPIEPRQRQIKDHRRPRLHRPRRGHRLLHHRPHRTRSVIPWHLDSEVYLATDHSFAPNQTQTPASSAWRGVGVGSARGESPPTLYST